jgi:hypothetical protein
LGASDAAGDKKYDPADHPKGQACRASSCGIANVGDKEQYNDEQEGQVSRRERAR